MTCSISKLVAAVAMVAPQFQSADALKLTSVYGRNPLRRFSLWKESLTLRAQPQPVQSMEGIPYAGQDGLPPRPADSFPAGRQRGDRAPSLCGQPRTDRVVNELPITLVRLQNNPDAFSKKLEATDKVLADIVADAGGLREQFHDHLTEEHANADLDFLVRLHDIDRQYLSRMRVSFWAENGGTLDRKLAEARALVRIAKGDRDEVDPFAFESVDMAATNTNYGTSWWDSDSVKPLNKILSEDYNPEALDEQTFDAAKKVAMQTLRQDKLPTFIAFLKDQAENDAQVTQHSSQKQDRRRSLPSLNMWKGTSWVSQLNMWKGTSSTGFLGRFWKASNGKGNVAALPLPSAWPIEKSGSAAPAAIPVGEQSPTHSSAPSSTASSAPSSPLVSPRGASDGRRAPSSPLNPSTNLEFSSKNIMDVYDLNQFLISSKEEEDSDSGSVPSTQSSQSTKFGTFVAPSKVSAWLQRKEVAQQVDAAEEKARLLSLTAANYGLIAGEGPPGTPTPTKTGSGIRRLSALV